MHCTPNEREEHVRQRLDAVRRLIGTTACDELLTGLELYAIELERRLADRKLH